MSYFNKPEYDAVKGLWVKERVKRVAMAIKTESGEIKVLGCTERARSSGQRHSGGKKEELASSCPRPMHPGCPLLLKKK